METSEKHLSKLNEICRTCGNKIVIKRFKSYNPKLASTYERTIQELFGYTLKDDVTGIHPPKLCDTCRKKLDDANKATHTTSDVLPVFQPHSDTSCNICNLPKVRNKGFRIIKESKTTSESSPDQRNQNSRSPFSLTEAANQCNLMDLSKFGDPTYTFAFIDKGFVMGFRFEIEIDGKWRLYHGKNLIERNNKVLQFLPDVINVENALYIFETISASKLCPGNEDFKNLIDEKINSKECSFKDKENNIKATIENASLSGVEDLKTIRVKDCELLVRNDVSRCEPCIKYRHYLHNIVYRRSVSPELPSKFTANKYLSKDNLMKKATDQQKQIKSLKRSLESMRTFVSQLVEDEGCAVENNLLKEVCNNVVSTNDSPFDKDSPIHLLWEQQKKQVSLENKRTMRWHPVMLRWCISIYLKSSGAYEHLRNSGFLVLPSKKTLDKYVNFTTHNTGFNPDVLENLLRLTENQQHLHVGLVHDEMKIKSGIVYSKNSGKIVGFCDLGDINNEITCFDRRVTNQDEHPPIATHVLTLMVRAINFHLNYPVAYFAGAGVKGYELYHIIWEAIRILEFLDFKVWFVVSDGASPNRKFYNYHKRSENIIDGVVYSTINKFDPSRRIYFICDVPHLIKTTRNCVANSHAHQNTRELFLDGKEISWQHVIGLLEYDVGIDRDAPGFHQTKLTVEHVRLTPRARMNVALAAQALSKSVADAMEQHNPDVTVSTRKLFLKMDEFFDIMNVKSTVEGIHTNKENLKPFKKPNPLKPDGRLDWLESNFLKFLNDWQAEIKAIPDVDDKRKLRMCLSPQTLNGLRITVHSTIKLIPILLKEPGIEFVLTDRFNQDPIEEHFGKQRARLGGCDNPSLGQYGSSEGKLIAAKDQAILVMRGNTSGTNKPKQKPRINIHDMTPLPKRPKIEKKKKKDADDDGLFGNLEK
ncbi:uncharacterized protein [Clytia hemisphaerica]|uniref:uncharacterized protein n=1 Tax=Clytia hemisphaerica TaxID=252671 RepID=UPI0034D6D0AF